MNWAFPKVLLSARIIFQISVLDLKLRSKKKKKKKCPVTFPGWTLTFGSMRRNEPIMKYFLRLVDPLHITPPRLLCLRSVAVGRMWARATSGNEALCSFCSGPDFHQLHSVTEPFEQTARTILPEQVVSSQITVVTWIPGFCLGSPELRFVGRDPDSVL